MNDKKTINESRIRIAEAKMLITNLVIDKCKLTESEYVQVLIALANDANKNVLSSQR